MIDIERDLVLDLVFNNRIQDDSYKKMMHPFYSIDRA